MTTTATMTAAQRRREERSNIVACKRCGQPCQSQEPTGKAARPFRRAKRGFCASCVVVGFLRGDENHGVGFALPPDFDPAGLLLPHIQQQFAQVLAVGGSELPMDQIDWSDVIRKWDVGLAAIHQPEVTR
jgi:hypothetical protein